MPVQGRAVAPLALGAAAIVAGRVASGAAAAIAPLAASGAPVVKAAQVALGAPPPSTILSISSCDYSDIASRSQFITAVAFASGQETL